MELCKRKQSLASTTKFQSSYTQSSEKPKVEPMRIIDMKGAYHPESEQKKTKPESERKKIEPMRIKDLLKTPNLESEMKKVAPKRIKELFSEPKPSTRYSVNNLRPTNNRVTARRTLYVKPSNELPKSRQSIKPNANRKSLLPPRNSIAEKYIKSKLNPPVKVAEKTNETIKINQNQRKSIAPSVNLQNKMKENSQKVTKNKEIPLVLCKELDLKPIDDDEELDESITDKENIPPPVIEKKKNSSSKVPLGENNEHQFDGLDFHPIDLEQELNCLELAKDINQLEAVDKHSINEIKGLINQQNDILTRNFQVLIEKSEENTLYLKTILKEVRALGAGNNINLISDNDKENQNVIASIRRKASRLSCLNNELSFTELENQCNNSTPTKSYFQHTRAKSEIELRTYMKCKSDVNFLVTPDTKFVKKFLNTPRLKRHISEKVLSNIENLYDD